MRVAYADPPYLGLAKIYAGQHPDAMLWDDPETHARLIERLESDFDGWALSLHERSLRTILPMTADHVRVMAWCKSWCSFKPGFKQAHHAWEPVLVKPARPIERRLHGIRDYAVTPIARKTGFIGAKPEQFCFWLFEVLNVNSADEFVDLFPGSGAVGRAWEKWLLQDAFLKPE